jgi:hypothetical protein
MLLVLMAFVMTFVMTFAFGIFSLVFVRGAPIRPRVPIQTRERFMRFNTWLVPRWKRRPAFSLAFSRKKNTLHGFPLAAGGIAA